MAEGCYIPKYYPSSFKGVPFEATDVSSEHGRRGAEGEFPFGEDTAYADLGRKIRRYNVKGRFVNNEHIASAELLIQACETPGPGLLLHPTRGAVLVACSKLSVTDNILEGQGITELDMEFVEANSIQTGFSFGESIFGISLFDIIEGLRDSFVSYYKIPQVSFYHVPRVRGTLSEGLNQFREQYAKAVVGSTDNSQWATLSKINFLIQDPTLLDTPKKAFDSISQASLALSSATTGLEKYTAFRSIADWSSKVSTLPDEAGLAQNAIYASVRTLSASNMAKAAIEVPIETLQVALNRYDEVVGIFEEELSAARSVCDDLVYLEISKFLTLVKTSLLKKAYDLPALVEYNFSGSTHSLMAAYEIFSDAKRFGEIEARNPGYWPFSLGPTILASRS